MNPIHAFETALQTLDAIANWKSESVFDHPTSWKSLALAMAARAQEALDIINKEEV